MHRIEQSQKGNGHGWHPLDLERERVSYTILTNPAKSSTNTVIIRPKVTARGKLALFLLAIFITIPILTLQTVCTTLKVCPPQSIVGRGGNEDKD